MTLKQIPSLHLLLTPSFSPHKTASTLHITLSFSPPNLSPGQELCCIYTTIGNSATQNYSASHLHVSDDAGPLPIKTVDDQETKLHSYSVTRSTNGPVVLKCTAHPIKVDARTPVGGRMDLRTDQGGLQCMGFSVLPLPWNKSWDTDTSYNTTISWDLLSAPKGTRAVSSFGEGDVKRIGPATDLWRMVFAVGPLRSYPPNPNLAISTGSGSGFGVYFFGSLPTPFKSLPPLCTSLFSKLSSFFRDELSSRNPYRLFIRRVTPAHGFGGTGALRSFVLEYDDAINTIRPDEVFDLLAHEMCHNYPLLLPVSTSGGREENLDLVAWFNEGVAEYYGTHLPYRFGLRSEEQWVHRVNAKLGQYYTNPSLVASEREVEGGKWRDTNLLSLSYTRGMVYLCMLDCEIKRATRGKKGVDGLVMEIVERGKMGRPHGVLEWRGMIEVVLGREGIEEFESMLEGKILRLPRDCFGAEWEVVRVEQKVLDFGFDMGSFQTRRISGLTEGSRAEEAGIREGDEIVWNTFTWQCQEEYERYMKMTLKRVEEEVEAEYWPRSEVVVESWQLRKKEKV